MRSPDWDELLLDLSEQGIITEIFMGENPDEDVIAFDWEKLKEYDETIYQVFWDVHQAEVQAALGSLVEQGLLDERLDSDGEIWYSVPDDVRQAIEDGRLFE